MKNLKQLVEKCASGEDVGGGITGLFEEKKGLREIKQGVELEERLNSLWVQMWGLSLTELIHFSSLN